MAYEEVTSPILTDATGQEIVDQLEAIAQAVQPPTNIDASDVTYDNTQSGMTATDVQDAVTELKSNLSQLDGLTVYKNLTPQTSYADFNDGSTLPLISLTSNIDPIQDLHGYDNPWVGGAGKNKLPLTVESIKTASDKSTWNNNSITINGVTYEIQVDTDGNVSGIKTNGTASGDSYLRIYDGGAEFHGKLLNGCPSNGSINTYYMQLSNVSVGSNYDLGNGTVITQTDTGRWILIINIKNGTTVSNLVFKPMIRLSSETDPTFEPYSNICPISGHTEANVSVSPTTDAEDGQTYNIQFKDGDNPLTVYGGTLDVISGELTVVPYFASYNGETLEGEWISDRDIYAVGTTPTVGAQVVNIGATPTTYQLTPTQVNSLLGQNYISSDTGDITNIKYLGVITFS